MATQIKLARVALGWTQSDLARHAGTSARTVWALERGDALHRPGTVERVLAALEGAGIRFTRDGGVRLAPRDGKRLSEGC